MKLTLTLITLIVSSASYAKRTVKSYEDTISKSKLYARTVRSGQSTQKTTSETTTENTGKVIRSSGKTIRSSGTPQNTNTYESQFNTSNQKPKEVPPTTTLNPETTTPVAPIVPNRETVNPAAGNTTQLSTMTNEVNTQSTNQNFNLFSEVDLAWRNLNENGETVSNYLSGSILVGYQIPTLFGLEGFEVSMRYQPSFLNSEAASANSQTILAGIAYEYSLMDNLGILGRAEFGAELPQAIEASQGDTPKKFLEPGFSSQLGVGVRYYINMIDFNKQLAVGFNVHSNLGSFIGITLGPSVTLFI